MDYAAQTCHLLMALFPKLLEGFTITLSVALTSMVLALALSVLLLGAAHGEKPPAQTTS